MFDNDKYSHENFVAKEKAKQNFAFFSIQLKGKIINILINICQNDI